MNNNEKNKQSFNWLIDKGLESKLKKVFCPKHQPDFSTLTHSASIKGYRRVNHMFFNIYFVLNYVWLFFAKMIN